MKQGWLITNEFLNSSKYTEINQWLVDAAKKQNIGLDVKTNAQVQIHLGAKECAGGGLNQENIDFVLFWDKDIRLAKYLEYMGLPVFNSAGAVGICDDKSLTHLVLQHHGIPMPETIIAPMTFPAVGHTNYRFLDGPAKILGFPMVIKECFGSFGQQVYLVQDKEELLSKVREIGSLPMLFQKYIATSFARDIRLQVVGGRVVAAMYRYSDRGDFRANISNGGKMEAYIPSEEEKALAIACCEVIGLDFAGVDLLFGEEGKPLVCEVNSNAHFKNMYDCTGVNGADEIISYIKKSL